MSTTLIGKMQCPETCGNMQYSTIMKNYPEKMWEECGMLNIDRNDINTDSVDALHSEIYLP